MHACSRKHVGPCLCASAHQQNPHWHAPKRTFAQVNIPKRQLLLSEQAALQRELAAHLKEGDVVEGIVHNTAPFGAFVKIKGPDGQMRGLSVCALPFCTCPPPPAGQLLGGFAHTPAACMQRSMRKMCIRHCRIKRHVRHCLGDGA